MEPPVSELVPTVTTSEPTAMEVEPTRSVSQGTTVIEVDEGNPLGVDYEMDVQDEQNFLEGMD